MIKAGRLYLFKNGAIIVRTLFIEEEALPHDNSESKSEDDAAEYLLATDQWERFEC